MREDTSVVRQKSRFGYITRQKRGSAARAAHRPTGLKQRLDDRQVLGARCQILRLGALAVEFDLQAQVVD